MAKQAKTEQLNLDDYDFGDEFDFDEFSLEPKPVKNKREAIERIGEGAWEGAKDAVKSPSFFRQFVKNALPRGFGDMLDLADNAATSVRELYNEGSKEAKPMLKDVGRVLDKMLPSASKYLPKGAERVLKDFAESQRDKPQSGIGANTATDMAVAAMMADTFRYNTKEEARREAKDDAREAIRDNVAMERHASGMEQMDGIRKAVVSMAAYQRRVEFGYQKKSLELQARQYFVAVDSLNEMKRSNYRTAELLSGIMHNTSLPDLIKMRASEKFKDMLRNKMMAGLQDGIFGQRNNFVERLGKAFRDQAIGSLREFTGGVRDGLGLGEMVADQAEMAEGMGVDKFRMAGNAAGGLATEWLGKLGATKLGKKIMDPGNKRMQGLRRMGNRMQYGVANAAQIATDYSNTYTDVGSTVDGFLDQRFGGRIPEGARGFLSKVFGFIGDPLVDLAKRTIRHANATDTTVKESGIADMYTPSAFTKQAHKSLVEVIPGYLARILQEQQIARTGNVNIDLLQYDYGRGGFSSTKALRAAVFNKLFDQQSRNGVKHEKNQLLEMIDPSGKLTPQQREELANILMKDNLRGRAGYEAGDIHKYLSGDNFAGSQHGEKYAELFRKLAEKDKKEEGQTNIQFAARFSNVGRSVADRRAEIQLLLETYPRDMLEDMGLIKPGSNQIDTEQINRYFSGEAYNAKAIHGVGGFRRLGHQRGGNAQVQLPDPHNAPEAPVNPVAEEIKRLIGIIELQNTKPLVSDIKDILEAMKEELHNLEGGGHGGSSTMDRVLDGASNAVNAAGRGARRARRQATVAGRRFLNAHQAQIDEARSKAKELAAQAKRQAQRAKRRGMVEVGRLRQRFQPQLDQANQFMSDTQTHAQDMWNNRPNMDELGTALHQRWQNAQEFAADTYERFRSDEFRSGVRDRINRLRGRFQPAQQQAQGVAANLTRLIQERTEQLQRELDKRQKTSRREQAKPKKDVFDQIRDILIHIRNRLDDGLVTTGGVPEGRMRRMGGAVKRGIGRLNMSVWDLVKGTANLGFGTAKLAGGITNSIVGGSVRTGWNIFKGTAGLIGDGVGFAAGSQYRRARGFVDVYVGNERRPRLFGRMLQEGNVYFDKATGKPIRRFRDITGDVIRKTDGEDQVVLTAEELEHAWQKVGPVKKSLKALGATVKGAYGIGKKVFGVVTGGIPPVFKMALWGAKKAWGLLDMAQDIFVKDRLDSPAMTARLMRAGAYYSATDGKVIKRPSQINGPVLIGDGAQTETVLTHDDIRKGLVDKNNRPIRTGLSKLLNFAFGGIKKAAGLAWKAGKLVNKAVTGLATGGYKLAKKAIGVGISASGGVFDILRGKNPFAQGPSAEITKKAVQLQTEQNNYLKEIRDVLRERLPKRKSRLENDLDHDGDGVRDGSYEDQMKRKAEAEKAKAEQAGQTPSGPGIGTRMKNGAKSLWDRLRGKKEGEEGGDTTIVSGGGGGGTKPNTPKGSSWKDSKGVKGKLGYLGRKGWGVTKSIGKFALGFLPFGGMLAEAGVGAALGAAGGAIASGAATVGGALATAGAAVAGVMTAPVLLGIAATAALGAGAYYGYKFLTKKRLGLLSRIRYAQYGFQPTDTDHTNAVFGLEDKLKDAIVYKKDGATLDPKRVDNASLFKMFDVDEKDRDAMQNWLRWFANRFRPVFLTHVTALKSVAGDKWLSDVDDLDPQEALRYLNATRFPEGPYSESTSPFKDLDTLPAGSGDVAMLVKIAETELKKKAPSGKVQQIGTAAAVATTAVTAATSATQTTTGVNPKALTAGLATTSTQPAKGAQIAAAGSSVILENLNADKLDGVDVVRLKAYGLVKMEVDKVRALQALEKYLTSKLVFNKNVATWNGSIEQVLLDNGSVFGVDSSNDAMVSNWISWFNQRFLPVFLNYASLMKAQTGKDDPAVGKNLLKANQAVDVATALFTTTGGQGSVWNVGVSPWEGYDLNTDVRSTDGNVQGLKDMAKAAVLVEPGGKAANQPTASKSAANTQTTQSTGIMAKTASVFSSAWQATKKFFGGGDAVQVGNNPVNDAPSGMGGGREMTQPGKGTGGDINAIPKPTGNKSWNALKDTILAAAKMVGVDGKLMAAMAAVESGFDYMVKASSSSASGLYQFVSGTWNQMLRKYGAKYGIAPNTPATDPRANALMGAEYLKESVNALEGKIGRAVTDTDIYFAHFLGPGGAKKFLTADPNAIAARILPDAARANPSIFFSKNGGALTVGQVYQLVNSRLQGKTKGLVGDGGEAMVASSSPSKEPAPAATGTASSDEKKTVETTATKPAYGVGTPATIAPDTTAKASTSSVPMNNGVPIAAVMNGFAPQRPVQDQVSSAKQQIELRVSNLNETNEILNNSLKVQRDSLEVLKAIRDGLTGSGKSNPTVQQPTAQQNATPTSQAARVAERRVTEMPRAPVSVARPANPFG